MTEQTAIIITQDYGSSLSTPTLRHHLTAAEIATADSANELSDASGWYALVFTESAVHAAGWYALRAFVSGSPINRFVYFTGQDGETAIAVDNLPVGLPQTGQVIVTRPVGDDTPITFSFPVASATLTGTRRINNAGSTTALSGARSFLRTSGTQHLYSLAYNAADRPSDDGVVEYVFTDGTYSRTVVLKAVTAVLDSALTADIESAAADAATLVTRLTNGRAANLDNLDVAISVVQSQITALNNLSAKTNWFGSLLLEIPDSSTRDYVFELVVKDDEDKLVNLDASPTIALVNAASADRASLITTGIANPSTGRYTLTVTVGTDTVNESLKLTASGTVSGEARYAVIAPQVVDYDNATQVALILTRIGTPSVSVSADVAAVSTKLGTPAGASVSADIASIKTDTGTTIPGLFTTLTTKIRKFFQLSLRKDAAIATDNATELTEINANGGSGGGGFLNTTDSQEATVDRGNAAWTTGGGGGGDSAATMLSTTIATVTSQTVLILTDGSADNDVYNDQLVVITDAVTSTQKARMLVSDYVGSTKTLTLASAAGFTVAAGDSIAIIAVAGLTSGQRNQLALIGAGTRMTVKADLGTSIALKIGDAYAASRSTAKRIDVNDSDSSIYDMLTGDEVESIDFGLSNATTIDVVTGTVDPETVTHTAASGSVSAYTTVYVEVDVDAALKPFCGDYDIQITFDDETRKTAFSGKCELVRDFKA